MRLAFAVANYIVSLLNLASWSMSRDPRDLWATIAWAGPGTYWLWQAMLERRGASASRPVSKEGKMSTITFYPTTHGSMLATHTYQSTLGCIERGEDVETTQMCALNRAKGYDIIRILECPDDVIEIFNNHDGTYSCDRTRRVLRRANDFFKLWENGEFA